MSDQTPAVQWSELLDLFLELHASDEDDTPVSLGTWHGRNFHADFGLTVGELRTVQRDAQSARSGDGDDARTSTPI